MPGALNLLVHRPLNPPVQRTINAILMSFGSYPFIVKGFYSFLYHDRTPFARDAELVREACDINRTPSLGRDVLDAAGAVTAPALIIWGRDDRVAGVRTASRFRQDIAGSQLAVIDDAGHMVHEEKPETVNHAIASFLDSGGSHAATATRRPTPPT
jgi:pimeloyl-ACP methyl ester carboxylesterase